MPRNLTGETYAVKHADALRPKEWGPGRSFEAWWPEIEERLDRFSALNSPFVEAVSNGTAPRPAIEVFIKDFVILAKEIPLHQSRIAAATDFHGENTVLIMSYGPSLALGYAGFRFLPDLAREFAAACGVGRSDLEAHELTGWAKAYLDALYDFADHVEMGVGATLVDAQWADLAPKLRAGFLQHYGVPEAEAEVFEALTAMDGPRTRMRPIILRDLAQTAYHQSTVRKAVRATTVLWRRMWDAWADPEICGLTFAPEVVRA
jgi:pyrroloquinoline quinone (PQQ) biosynthesis protein C